MIIHDIEMQKMLTGTWNMSEILHYMYDEKFHLSVMFYVHYANLPGFRALLFLCQILKSNPVQYLVKMNLKEI